MASSVQEIIERENCNRQLETERFVEEQQIKKSLAPEKWSVLLDGFHAECKKMVTADVRIDVIDKNNFQITNFNNSRRASFRYDPNCPCIHAIVGNRKTTITFKVISDGTDLKLNERLQGASEGRSVLPKDIVDEAMMDLFRPSA